MNEEIVSKLEGYPTIAAEIAASRKYGSSFLDQRGEIKAFINRLHPKQVALKVIDIRQESPSTKTLRFAAVNGYLPPFQAGQYISLILNINTIRTSRPYSISSSPTEKGFWELTIKRVEDGLVSGFLLDNVKIGDTFVSSGPQGTFCYNPLIHKPEMVCLAGGSGITPFISMIREVISKGLERTIHLIYGSRTLDDAIFHTMLEEYAQKYPTLTYNPVIEHPPAGYIGLKGLITADVIKKITGSLQDKPVFICGPQAMYDYCLQQLERLDYPRSKIRREMYGMPAHIWQAPGWPENIHQNNQVTVFCNGKKIGTCTSSQSLITVLENNHTPISAICRSGECSMCRVKLVKGKVFQPAGTLLRKSDQLFGFIHACASYPLTDIEIIA